MDKLPDSIKFNFNVPLSVNDAFNTFFGELHVWWPKEYTWAREVLEHIEIEPEENGRCYERGPHGFECDWGRVLKWHPPNRVIFSWQVSPNRVPEPNPEISSKVEVQFNGMRNNTKVNFEHRDFSNHGEGAESYREALNSSEGWPYIIDNYKKLVTRRLDIK